MARKNGFQKALDAVTNVSLRKRLNDVFGPYYETLIELKSKVTEPMSSETAKEIQSALASNRIKAEKIRQSLKQPYLAKGRDVDGIAKKIINESKVYEDMCKRAQGKPTSKVQEKKTDIMRLEELAIQIENIKYPEMESKAAKEVNDKVKVLMTKAAIYIRRQMPKV